MDCEKAKSDRGCCHRLPDFVRFELSETNLGLRTRVKRVLGQGAAYRCTVKNTYKIQKIQSTIGKAIKAEDVNPSESMSASLDFEVQRELTALGMTSAQIRVLGRIMSMLTKDGTVILTGTYLAKSLGIRPQSANKYLRMFEEWGFICRYGKAVIETFDDGLKKARRRGLPRVEFY